MPGMRTSEIIMLISSERSTARACSPEATGLVSKPCVFRKESSKLRWPASSSTIRMRGPFGALLTDSVGITSRFSNGFQVADTKNRAARFMRTAFDFPTMSQHDLLHHGQAQTSAFLVSGEVRFEDIFSMLRQDPRTIVAHFNERFRGAHFAGHDLDFTVGFRRLDGVKQEI